MTVINQLINMVNESGLECKEQRDKTIAIAIDGRRKPVRIFTVQQFINFCEYYL